VLGCMQVLDVRVQRWLNVLKGQVAGSVRHLSLTPDGHDICSVGLDRWLRVHECSRRSLHGKVYLKTQLAACCWAPPCIPADAEQETLKRKRDKGDA
jgi:hypothetical protein